MQGIQWQENDLLFERQNNFSQSHGHQIKEMMTEEQEDYEAIQLKKFDDPSKDEHRQACLALIERFGSLFADGNIQEIAKELLTEDFEVFIFSSTGRTLVQHADHPQGFIDLYTNRQILERKVRETHVDVDKNTACQISYCRAIYSGNSTPVDEVVCEIFSLRNGRISKLRVSSGCLRLNNKECEDPLEPTRKDRMLAQVKETNYILAGQPDFEKLAKIFNENTEYKIWRWDDSKCFTLNKSNLVSLFKEIEENMSIKCIVPYEISTDPEAKLVSANYVYHLEDRKSGQRFYWLSTCIFSFDNHINISSINQQGELYPEGEIDIPFEVYTREKLESITQSIYAGDLGKLDSFYADTILYDCSLWSIYSAEAPNAGYVKGFKSIENLLKIKETLKDVEMKLVKMVDIYVDHYNESHDVVFALNAFEGTKPSNEALGKKEAFDSIEFVRMAFEKGKLAKMVQFISTIDVPISSPFDDKNFRCLNIT